MESLTLEFVLATIKHSFGWFAFVTLAIVTLASLVMFLRGTFNWIFAVLGFIFGIVIFMWANHYSLNDVVSILDVLILLGVGKVSGLIFGVIGALAHKE
ncbi:MAG: hypothetical protein N0C84_00385 [Candidatus Thiodiazotropha taylori]|uniref:Uncharacterized protein n=1 Tax=Candidatus Thiodiazotropha taylori TaxID=2792791 RepID=A0A9E4N1H3_9GAMM|nr:hypothetical protein [Candidatus Thiodiazotropha taylori]MCW4254901.1 hypothetical protein [Candidatus Thiodiazotropha taylori]